MPFLSSLDNLLLDAHIIFRKSVDNFEIAHKNMLILSQGCSTPNIMTKIGLHNKRKNVATEGLCVRTGTYRAFVG